MAGTAAGGVKLRQTMIKKYGSEEAWKEHMREKASKGGKNGTGHAFGHGKVDPRKAGLKGGRISRRGGEPVYPVEEYQKPKKRFALWGR